nr:MAG TPA: putative tail component [Caudoviricetes sp.]
MATVKGLDKLHAKFNAIANINVAKAVKKATTFVQGQAKELAPFDTGRLKGSIRMKVDVKDSNVIGKVYTNLEYAPYLEFGTGIRGDGSYPYSPDGLNLTYKKDWKGMKARPYMYPALKGAENYVKTMINEEIKLSIKSICKGRK